MVLSDLLHVSEIEHFISRRCFIEKVINLLYTKYKAMMLLVLYEPSFRENKVY